MVLTSSTGPSPGLRGAPRRVATLVAAVLVALTMLESSSSLLQFDYGTRTWEPSSPEEWLYRHYYASYDRDVWGGTPVRSAAAVDSDGAGVDAMSVPVFAYLPQELTSEHVQGMAGRITARLGHVNYTFNTFTSDDIVLYARVGCPERGLSFTIHRDGRHVLDQMGFAKLTEFPSCASFRSRVEGWLEGHGLLPNDVGNCTVRRSGQLGGDGLEYVLTMTRSIGGWRFDPGLGFNKVEARFRHGDLHVLYHWPELSVPFYVTDLPPLSQVLSAHHLSDGQEENGLDAGALSIHYCLASVHHTVGHFFMVSQAQVSDIYFYLPYLFEGEHRLFGGYGRVFPDQIDFLFF